MGLRNGQTYTLPLISEIFLLFSRTQKRRPRKRRPCKPRPKKHRRGTNTKIAFARERNEFKSLSSSFLFLFEVCVFDTPRIGYSFALSAGQHHDELNGNNLNKGEISVTSMPSAAVNHSSFNPTHTIFLHSLQFFFPPRR